MNSRLEVKVPFENVNDPSAKVLSWAVPSGATVREGDVLVELENSKTTFQVSAPAAGVVEYSAPVGQEVSAGEALFFIVGDATIGTQTEAVPSTKMDGRASASPVQGGSSGAAPGADTGTASPVFSQKALRLLEELGMDASLFSGMATVRESDVRQKASAANMGRKDSGAGTPVEAKQSDADKRRAAGEEGEEVRLERSKLLENRELSTANTSSLKSTIYYLCPAYGFRESCLKQSPPIDRLGVILFEAVSLLTKSRYLNGYYVEQNAFLYRHVNIGFAVDIDRGLKVLTIRKAEELSFPQLTAKVEELLVKYSTNTLTTEDLTGSTFTVTDLAQQGVFSFEALLNSRQAAILAIGSEQAGIGGFMLSCTFDHRLTTGKVVAEFLHELSFRLLGHAESIRGGGAGKSQPSCSRCFATAEELRGKEAFLVSSVEPAGYICSRCLAGY